MILDNKFNRLTLKGGDIMKIRKLKKLKTTCWFCPWLPVYK